MAHKLQRDIQRNQLEAEPMKHLAYQLSYKQRLALAIYGASKVRYPYGKQALGYKPVDVWDFLNRVSKS